MTPKQKYDERKRLRLEREAANNYEWQSMSDWSGMPDVYVTKFECQSGLIWRIEACSVPMAIGPEVRLVNAKELAEAQAKIARLTEALKWYGEQARLCRLIHSEGDAGRNALNDDGGKRALAALQENADE